MNLIDVFGLSVANMRGRKLRSWLTVLGIVIAVASIVTLLALAFGVDAQVRSRLNLLGNDIIQITPGGQQATRTGGGGFGGGGEIRISGGGGAAGGFRFGGDSGRITFDDLAKLRRVDGVLEVDGRIDGRERTEFKGFNASLQVVGIDPSAFKAIANPTMIAGKTLNDNDRYSVVLGYRVYSNTFKDMDILNKQIKIGDSYFRVVGAINQTSGSFVSSDNNVYIPMTVAKQLLNESTNVGQVFVKVKPGYSTDAVAAKLDEALLIAHRLTAGKEDFTITTASFLADASSSITGMLTLFLGGIAAISLIVGAIGVANTMFMSVLERTREIGVLKALGMKDREITAEFLIEAGLIGFLGGVLGIALSLTANYVLGTFGVATLVTTELLVGAILFSALVGIISGVLPARNAAKLQPVEALRYE
ncbi:MAG: ABC transporter permease [Candidatus Micrarchaeota archaeon]